jgi:hypothetical protein
MVPMIRSLRRLPAFALVLATGVFLCAVLAAPAYASPCGKKILKDWSNNSRIDGTYELHCYQDAIDALPVDLRDYSDAPEVIGRAFREAGGRNLALSRDPTQQKSSGGEDAVTAGASPSSLPIPLLVLGGVALALLSAGGVGYVSRRRRTEETD